MYKKEFGFLLGLLGIFLWFTPLIYLDVDKMKGSFFDGLVLYQTGHHIGGIAYLLLLSCAAYSYSSWLCNNEPRITTARCTGKNRVGR